MEMYIIVLAVNGLGGEWKGWFWSKTVRPGKRSLCMCVCFVYSVYPRQMLIQLMTFRFSGTNNGVENVGPTRIMFSGDHYFLEFLKGNN